MTDCFSLQDEVRQRSWELPDSNRMLRRQNAAMTDNDEACGFDCPMDDVFFAEDLLGSPKSHMILKKTASEASEGKFSSVSNISKERSGSNDSMLDRDSDYSSSISTHLVAELEQQVM